MIFVDTGAFLGRYLARDQHHRAAVRGWKRLKKGRAVTSNLVLTETFTLLGCWAGHEFAAERARSTLQSEFLSILRPGLQDEVDAVELFEKYADQKMSFTDCISFVLMRKHGVDRAFSFDRHFRTAGFKVF